MVSQKYQTGNRRKNCENVKPQSTSDAQSIANLIGTRKSVTFGRVFPSCKLGPNNVVFPVLSSDTISSHIHIDGQVPSEQPLRYLDMGWVKRKAEYIYMPFCLIRGDDNTISKYFNVVISKHIVCYSEKSHRSHTHQAAKFIT